MQNWCPSGVSHHLEQQAGETLSNTRPQDHRVQALWSRTRIFSNRRWARNDRSRHKAARAPSFRLCPSGHGDGETDPNILAFPRTTLENLGRKARFLTTPAVPCCPAETNRMKCVRTENPSVLSRGILSSTILLMSERGVNKRPTARQPGCILVLLTSPFLRFSVARSVSVGAVYDVANNNTIPLVLSAPAPGECVPHYLSSLGQPLTRLFPSPGITRHLTGRYR